MYVIITHTDADGWASEYVVRKYLNEVVKDSEPIAKFNYNYSGDISLINKFIEKNLYQISDIFMTDITLPDEFMDKYAEYITHIDHHKSSVESNKDWKKKLRNNFSYVSLPGYTDKNGYQTNQISSCELTWKFLFPSKHMPDGIYLIGRNDVWDHSNSEDTLNLNAYIYNYLNEYKNDIPLTEEFEKLIEDDYTLFGDLFLGKEIRNYKSILDSTDSLSQVSKVIIFDTKVAVINRKGINSTYYDKFIEKNPDVELLINYGYSPKTKTWKISCYTVKNKNTSALEFIKKFYDVIPDIISLGGHEKACGFSIRKDDIIKFLDTFNNI